MNTLAKSDPLGTLGLPPGDHWVKFHVEEDTISYEVAASPPEIPSATSAPDAALNFVRKWSGQGKLLSEPEMSEDARLAELTEKHLR
jgi:hypothetical protein